MDDDGEEQSPGDPSVEPIQALVRNPRQDADDVELAGQAVYQRYLSDTIRGFRDQSTDLDYA